jgi:probable O-glycosylation ligase (exosortase A-associated)
MKGLIFTYLMTYGGALSALFNPFTGLLIYVCFSIIRPESLWHWSVPAGNYSRIVALGLLGGWAINGFGNWDFGRAKPIVYALLAYWFWACLSALSAEDKDRAWKWVEAQGKIVLPFLVGMTIIDSVRQLKQLAWVIVLGHGYVACELNLSFYDGFNALHEIGFGGMDNNSFSIALCASSGLAFFLALNAEKWWQKLLAFASTGFSINAIFFAYSRGGVIGLIITAAVSFILIPKKPKHYIMFILTVLLAYRLAGPAVVDRFMTAFASEGARDSSAQGRIDMWGICLNQMMRFPLFGLGPHHFPHYASSFGLTPFKEAHSLWLQLGAELGIPGLLFLVSFYWFSATRLGTCLSKQHASDDPWFADTARMVIAALTGFAISAQFVSLPGLETPYYIVLLGAGALKLQTSASALAAREQDTAPTYADEQLSPASV